MANKFDVKKEELQGEKKDQDYCYLCQDCEVKFSLEGRKCPRCGSMNTKIAEVRRDDYVIKTQKDCFDCLQFQEKNQGGIFGPGCSRYGDKPIKGEEAQMCKDCKCIRCCIAEQKYKEILKLPEKIQKARFDEYYLNYEMGSKHRYPSRTPDPLEAPDIRVKRL